MRTNTPYIILQFLLLLLSTPISYASSNNPNSSRSAYEILELPKTATQEDVKRSYRAKCLALHPDKTVQLPSDQRKLKEEEFKHVQMAHSQIGTEEARRQYDLQRSSPFYGAQNMGDFVGNYDDFVRSFMFAGQGRSPMFHMSFGPNGARFRRGDNYNPFFTADAAMNNQSNSKAQSIYEQTVSIPLHELYTGVRKKRFRIKDGILQRCRAAFRGSIGQQIAVQAMFTFLTTMLRTRHIWLSSIFAALLMYINLPKVQNREVVTDIQRGWKGGTKLKFNRVEPGISIVILLEEQRHDRYIRVGDDLETDAVIGRSKAKKGCTLLIDHLVEGELPIEVKVKPGDLKVSRKKSSSSTTKQQKVQVIRVEGRGWPKKSGERGDLLIHVRIVSDKEALKHQQRIRKRKINKAL